MARSTQLQGCPFARPVFIPSPRQYVQEGEARAKVSDWLQYIANQPFPESRSRVPYEIGYVWFEGMPGYVSVNRPCRAEMRNNAIVPVPVVRKFLNRDVLDRGGGYLIYFRDCWDEGIRITEKLAPISP